MWKCYRNWSLSTSCAPVHWAHTISLQPSITLKAVLGNKFNLCSSKATRPNQRGLIPFWNTFKLNKRKFYCIKNYAKIPHQHSHTGLAVVSGAVFDPDLNSRNSLVFSPAQRSVAFGLIKQTLWPVHTLIMTQQRGLQWSQQSSIHNQYAKFQNLILKKSCIFLCTHTTSN